jgi:hypothetical protein
LAPTLRLHAVVLSHTLFYALPGLR